ncbi:hypothetical protein [Pseudoroseomonas ludipueritiae]|uniref:Uncharacterized protein n=1 Tax=Pseudoroseomonas ludipueritiae TaxID=198093 RepID=A0ABR7RB27_9PROT|nr:hypothetical protein [Pseudoroseomonas ludipueritiae]MBC9178635.1 hypothetical protein [Pseudoroseomonas ludipueritiae]MCG7361771.1 hypothetical protein [Roseomonas sp. ACRSG]
MEEKSFDGAALEQALQDDAFAKPSAVELTGMVKKAGRPGVISFTRAGCENWIDLPISMIDQARHKGSMRCKDHSHPVFRITFKEPQNPEAAVFAALLAQTSSLRPEMHDGPMAVPGQASIAPPGMMSSMPAQDMSLRAGTIRRSDGAPSPGMPGGGAAARINVGGLGGQWGRLNAWGCWDSCCESRCAAGHYENSPIGPQWVCDWWICTDPCERCIWPY